MSDLIQGTPKEASLIEDMNLTQGAEESTLEQNDRESSHEEPEPQGDLCDAWTYTLEGGHLEYKGIYYDIRRIPHTLSDRLMSTEQSFGSLPHLDAPGILIIGDQITPMTLKEVESRKKELEDRAGEDELFHLEDGPYSTKEDLEAAKMCIESDIFTSLPLIKFDSTIHHAKVPRSIKELENLKAVQGVPHLVELVGRTDDGRFITSKFGYSLHDWIIGPCDESGRRIPTPDKTKYQWVVDIALGLLELHNRGIIHKDLASQNILVQGDHAMICDLECGATSWEVRPPEFVQQIKAEYDEKMDIYGLGVLLWIVENRNQARCHRSLECGGVFAGLMERCLKSNRDDRPTVDEVVEILRGMPETCSLLA